jgi:hypothetical protein
VAAFGALSALQCSASSDDTVGGGGNSGNPDGSTGGFNSNDGSIVIDSQAQDYSAEQFFLNDPPPLSCDGGGNPPKPGGTPECPDDKNLQGCPCTVKGATAPCWPGLRKHRNHGNCKDGTTECILQGEVKLVWGECKGFQGLNPTTLMPLGTTGKAACLCFSGGYWDIDNLSPCFISSAGGAVMGAVSTVMPGNCPDPNGIDFANPVPPTAIWSTNTVTVDCTGNFKLCYTLKALSTPNGQPGAGDCTMKQVCTEAYYGTKDQPMTFPDLPGWITQNASENSCAQAFVSNGGYGEMSVKGESDECDKVEKVFNTVIYCPLKCADPANASDPECVNCQPGGGGPF